MPRSITIWTGSVVPARSGARLKYLFFWGHTPKSPAGRRGVSEPVVSGAVRGRRRALRQRRALHDVGQGTAVRGRGGSGADRGRRASQGGQDLGRTIRKFDEDTWVAERVRSWRRNVEKFRQNPDLLAFLLGTGERVLVEASPMDRIWGIGLAARRAGAGSGAVARAEPARGGADGCPRALEMKPKSV